MDQLTRRAAAALGAVLLVGASPAVAQTASAIEGVWRVTKVVITGAGATSNPRPQPGIYIFSRGYYSNVWDNSGAPRTQPPAFRDPAHPTDAEKASKYEEWAPVSAQAGTYEIRNGMFIRHPIVAKNMLALSLDERPVEIKLTGKTLTIISTSAPGQPVREQRLTLTRLR